jgi:hypothetical protein
MRAAWILAITALAVGCTDPCKEGTLFVSFDLSGIVGIDGVDVTVTVAGQNPKANHLPIEGGVSKGSVEIDFPAGYPRDQSVNVHIDVKAGAILLASGSDTLVLSHGCESVTVALTAAPMANKHQGDPCGPDDICDTGNCVDGVCCDSPCTGQCQACDTAGAVGTCATVSDGTPHGLRAACAGTGTCGGSCNGARAEACSYPAATIICGAACDGHCDGAGMCSSVAGGSCPGGFSCTSSGCKTSCGDDNDCQPNFKCMAPSCQRVPESDCLDGKDNNGDALADCQDPTCVAAVSCVPAIPQGDELGVFTNASCPTDYPTAEVQHQGLNAPSCTTSGCGCDPLVTCQISFGFSGATDCSSPTNVTQTTTANLANPLNGDTLPCATYGANIGSLKLNSVSYVGTSCGAKGSTTPPAISWTTTTTFCAAARTSDTCGPQQVCASKPPTGVAACIRIPQAGASCPVGYGGQSATWYSQATDNRMCTCGCSVIQNGACGTRAAVDMNQTTSCPITLPLAGGCQLTSIGGCFANSGFTCVMPSPVGAYGAQAAGASGAQCSATVTGSGAATPAGASTICCQ